MGCMEGGSHVIDGSWEAVQQCESASSENHIHQGLKIWHGESLAHARCTTLRHHLPRLRWLIETAKMKSKNEDNREIKKQKQSGSHGAEKEGGDVS